MTALLATTGSPLLAAFNTAGVLGVADVHLGRSLCRMGREGDERIWLAAALTVRALRGGSVCIEPATVAGDVFELEEEAVAADALAWPEPVAWLAALEASPAVTVGVEARGLRPLRLVDGRLYLERYWGHEETVRTELLARRERPLPAVDLGRLRLGLDELFDGDGLAPDEPDLQRRATATAALAWVSIVAGGPGTGKTTTVARLLSVLSDLHEGPLSIRLAAPTGKAAVRLEESLRAQLDELPERSRARLAGLSATTMHRLLGWRRDSQTRFARHRGNPLAADVVVIDEVSMVSLHLMARLLEALPPTARLVLVGDPDQLASVEAGAVLADITRAKVAPLPALAAALAEVDPDGLARRGAAAAPMPATGAVELRHVWRFGTGISALATAIREGDAASTLAVLRSGDPSVGLVEGPLTAALPPGLDGLRRLVVDAGRGVVAAAREGKAEAAIAALDSHRLLAGHRSGPYGVARWSWQAERWLAEAIPGYGGGGEEFYVGRQLLISENLRDLQLFNGDTGVVIAVGDALQAAFARGGVATLIPPANLAAVSTLLAMTIHKSQGSQFGAVSLILPPVDSPLATRELLYTAVTRARDTVTLYGVENAIRQAVERPARRASGLRQRL